MFMEGNVKENGNGNENFETNKVVSYDTGT